MGYLNSIVSFVGPAFLACLLVYERHQRIKLECRVKDLEIGLASHLEAKETSEASSPKDTVQVSINGGSTSPMRWVDLPSHAGQPPRAPAYETLPERYGYGCFPVEGWEGHPEHDSSAA